MTEEQLHIVQEINTSDLCSIISSRNSSLEDEIRRLKNENKLLGERCNQLLTDKGKLTDENAELKEINEGYCRNRDRLISIGFPNFKDCKEYAEQLAKAKEIIMNLRNIITSDITIIDTEEKGSFFKQAVEFLKEIEK